ncbi:phenoloxidase-activating enzyme-like [Anopheles maculipalpis]|uniref:phenoloxidase-activating enzyme-like n=1 Tax=Anopheles maculipalpis TaxID=1496333 RepID=UPI002158F515|nr:phenoloxidase-activating enzyme-like [Anopheles maculipalpis]
MFDCVFLIPGLLLRAPVLASSTDGEATNHDNSSATLSFPAFFRSRFNPRTLQQNERLITALDDIDVQPGMNATQPWSSFTWSGKQSDDKVLPNAGNTIAEDVKHQSNRVVQPVTESTPDQSLEQECGIVAPGVDGFPWIAVLEHGGPQANAALKRTLSKGVLIDRQHVLTTVSSVHNSHPTWVVTSVRLGDTPTRRQTNVTRAGNHAQRTNGTQRYEIETVFLHEKKDIALIRLADGGVRQLTDTIRPICLPREDYRLENFKLTAHVCQRRLEPTGRVSRSRLQPLELVSVDSCNELMRPYGARLPVKSFCAREAAHDNCTGTLGGPAIASVRGKYHVLGLRSYIHTETMVDGLDLPSIYVRVGGLRKWISAVIKAISD